MCTFKGLYKNLCTYMHLYSFIEITDKMCNYYIVRIMKHIVISVYACDLCRKIFLRTACDIFLMKSVKVGNVPGSCKQFLNCHFWRILQLKILCG